MRNKSELTNTVFSFFEKYDLNVQKKVYFQQFKPAVLIINADLGKSVSNSTERYRESLNLWILKASLWMGTDILQNKNNVGTSGIFIRKNINKKINFFVYSIFRGKMESSNCLENMGEGFR